MAMIVYKEWAVNKKKEDGWTIQSQPYLFKGYFLFGIIPLYVQRIGF